MTLAQDNEEFESIVHICEVRKKGGERKRKKEKERERKRKKEKEERKKRKKERRERKRKKEKEREIIDQITRMKEIYE